MDEAKTSSVEFTLTKADVTEFNLYHQRHSRAARNMFLRGWLVAPVIGGMICTGIWRLADSQRGTPLQTFLDLLPLFAFVPIYLLIYPWFYRRQIRKLANAMVSEGKNNGILEPRTVSLQPAAITESSSGTETVTKWQTVERVVVTDDALYVYLNALSAIIVPRRAFPSETAFAEFATAAKDRCAAANHSSSPA